MYRRAGFSITVSILLGLLAVPLAVASESDLSNLGQINFPTSGKKEAQEHFNMGVLLLHSFEFEDSAEAFRKAQAIDPDFALAYWGESMTHNHPLWRQVDVEKGRAALNGLADSLEGRLVKAPTKKEKDFLRTLEALYGPGDKSQRDAAYSEALGRMYQEYPDDHEVACFYALSLLGLTNGQRDFRNYMKAASIVEEVFAENPRHPGAVHYMIHSYDDPIHAPLGLRAARVYATIAPTASHAQHMISHIHVALGRWDDAIIANKKAWAVSQERVEKKNRPIAELDFHSYSWLHYAYLQQGRYREAQAMLKIVDDYRTKTERNVNYARMRSGQVVETRDWQITLPPASDAGLDHFAEGLIAIGQGNFQAATDFLGRIKADEDADRIARLQLEALIAHKQGFSEQALKNLKETTSIEDEMPLAFGPPLPNKPAHELLGELLLELDRPAEARQEFEKALQRAPRRALSLLGLARSAARSGEQDLAAQTYETLAEMWRQADPNVPGLEEVRRYGGGQANSGM